MEEREKKRQLERAATGDRDALQRLVVHYHATVRGRVCAASAEGDQRYIDADDVLQHAYIAVFKSAPGLTFDGPGHFYKWLERVALNKLRDAQRALRRAKRDVRRMSPPPADKTATRTDLVQRIAADGPSPSRVIAKDEAVAAVMTCLARLGDDQRRVVQLRIIEDVPVSEIARRMGKTEVAVYALCRRGLKSLHDLLGPLTRYLSSL